MRSTVLPFSDTYREAIHFALLQQVPCALLCLLLLDGGRMAKVCGVAVLAFWAAAALIMARRPNSPGPGDIAFLRWGFLPLFALVVVLAQLA
ncbi:MAG: hypothetical protein KatS3mg108_2451 [Isosphaeraceae bacterium]|jgi:hypothetical protein|nr:MAG: hypothetical protein KatS3mg108_2451 [Isosphaeraceae bacterium]